MDSQPSRILEIFCSYSHRDEELRKELKKHLKMLERRGLVTVWHDRQIGAGEEWKDKIDEHLESADIILLLISPDFIDSDYCYDIEMTRAMERHEAREARVIPIFLRHVNWKGAPFGKIQGLPTNIKPVTSWPDKDEAFEIVSSGVEKLVEVLLASRQRRETAKPVKLPASSLIPRPPIIGFVARTDAEGRDIVERLNEELALRKNQPVTLSGPGGVGKTTLAAEAARTLEEAYEGRVVWSDVTARASFSFSALLDDIATQLGQPGLRTLKPEEKEAQVRALVANPPALVVLDNYETIPPDEQRSIETWLDSTRRSALITSRQRIEKTRNIIISAMSPDEAEEFLKRLIEQTQDPQIFSTEVRQRIYETAEANPFVMEWIVAQIDQAKEPNTVLEELEHGVGDAAERVFDRSFNLTQLGDDGRAALLALSLFAPNATRKALAAVAGFGDDQNRLNEAVKILRDLWLIKGLEQNRRFTINGLTRSLASSRLSKDERAAEFRQHFIAYFRSYTEAHQSPTPEDYDALEREKGNLLTTLDEAYEMKDWNSLLETCAVVVAFLYVRGYWDEVIQRGEQALRAAYNAEIPKSTAIFKHYVARTYKDLGYLKDARQLYEESLEIYKSLNQQEGVAAVLNNLASILKQQGELEKARRFYDESVEIKKGLGYDRNIASALHQMAIIAQGQGEIGDARRLYNESLEIKRRLDDQSGIAATLNDLGIIAQGQGEIEDARRLYDESLEIEKKLGNRQGIAISLFNLGLLAEVKGDNAEAPRLYSEALKIFERLKSPIAGTARAGLERVTKKQRGSGLSSLTVEE